MGSIHQDEFTALDSPSHSNIVVTTEPHSARSRRPGQHVTSYRIPSRSSATSNSNDACMFIRNLDVVPKYRARRRAVSAVMPRFSLTISLMRVAGTRSAIANWCAVMSIGDRNLFAENFSRMNGW